jgi:excinuclease UvrABC nuclease subunit
MDKVVIESWLGKKRGSAIDIQCPVRGNKKELVDTVAVNAERGLQELKIKQISNQNSIDTAIAANPRYAGSAVKDRRL